MRAPSAPGIAVPSLRSIALPSVLRGRETAAALALLVVIQWGAVLAFALTVRHNGWLYYQGGDQLWHYTTAWLLADGELPFTTIGYAWPFLLLPIAAVFGPNLLDGLPAILLLNVLVLLPGALVALYALGARLGGRAVGLGAAALWVTGPWVAVPLFEQDYHEKYVELFLPQVTGLTAMADLPSTIALLVAALLTVRALDHDDAWAGAAAGLAVGVAVAVKPSVAIALPAFVAALAVAGRWRGLLGAGAALALPLLALAVWKARGVGYLPAFASSEVHLAGGTDVFAPVEKYVDWSFDHLHQIERDLRGEFFSARLLEVIGLAGIVALARRTLPGAILVGGWFLLVVLVRAGSPLSSIDSGSFFRYVMPAYPAFCVLAASLLLLVPRLGGRLAAAPRPGPPSCRSSIVVTGSLAATFALVLAVTALAKPVDVPVTVRWHSTQPLIPVVDEFRPRISTDAGRITLRWRPTPDAHAATFYRIFRGQGTANACSDEGGALYCTLVMRPVGETRQTVFTEEPPEAGRWVYRVSVTANWLDDITQGDPMLMSEPVETTTG